MNLVANFKRIGLSCQYNARRGNPDNIFDTFYDRLFTYLFTCGGVSMADAWYEGLPDDAFRTETGKAYEKSFAKIKEVLAQGLDFDTACAAIEVEDEELKKSIIDDMLKVLIAEEHFTKNIPLDELAQTLRVSVDRLESAKLSMLEDVKDASIKAFHKTLHR
jgi:hypothetical protein